MHKVNTIPADALPPGHQKLWYHPIETFPVCMMVIFWEYSGNSGKCCENVSSPRADTGTIGKTLVRIILWCPTTTRTTRTPAFWGYPRRLMITHTIESCGIPSQNMIEWLEDIGQGQRSSHATHLLMLVIICTKYGKNPSKTVDARKGTRFSRSRPNDLEI